MGGFKMHVHVQVEKSVSAPHWKPSFFRDTQTLGDDSEAAITVIYYHAQLSCVVTSVVYVM